MKLIKNYMKDDKQRHGLNELTRKTFYFDFESWVTEGYYEGDYIPYSFEENGKIISNVSANIMDFEQNGKLRNYIQIGTVMTDEKYRKQGLARQLMEQVLNDYEDKCDGVYLFANLSAVDFYKKIGFQEKMQWLYSLKKDASIEKISTNTGFVRITSDDVELKKRYKDCVRRSASCSAFEQVNKYGLQMFYTANTENIYYSKTLDCFVVMEMEEDLLELQSVICTHKLSLQQIISEINVDYAELRLGFTPKEEDAHLFDAKKFDGGEDYRLLCRGEKLDSIENEKLYFPLFSHA